MARGSQDVAGVLGGELARGIEHLHMKHMRGRRGGGGGGQAQSARLSPLDAGRSGNLQAGQRLSWTS